VYLPLALRRLADGLATTLVDGLYLVAWPLPAFLLPPLVLLLGVLLGATHPGYVVTVTESIPLLLLLVVLGTASGHLGLAFLAGYVLGDVFLFNLERLARLPAEVGKVLGAGDPPAAAVALAVDQGAYWLPLVIQYGLMALPLCALPLLTKALVRSLAGLALLGPWAGSAAAAAVHAALTFAVVYLWTQSVPLLIRPLFVWRGEAMNPAAVAPAQDHGPAIAAVAVVAALGRMALQALTAYVPRVRAALDPALARLGAAPPLTPLADRTPRPLAALGRALSTALLMGGLYAAWADWAILFALVLLLEAARVGLVPVPLGRWPELSQRLPVVVRVGATFGALLVLANALAPLVADAETFRPVLLLAGASLVVSFLLNPVSPLAPRAQAEAAS
jgi:hypothetical protein